MAVAFDEKNKHHNLMFKNISVVPSIDIAVMRLHHVMTAEKAAK